MTLVKCPACKGAKVSCVTGRHPCPCCAGLGKISKDRDEMLKLIRADLAAAIAKRERKDERKRKRKEIK